VNPRGKITGSTESVMTGVSLEGFLQFIRQESKSTRLTISGNNENGVLHFDSGQLNAAFCNHLEGQAALFEMLTWKNVIINMEPTVLHPTNIHGSLPSLLLEAARTRDETLHVDEMWVALEKVLEESTAFGKTELVDLKPKPTNKEFNMANVKAVLDEVMSIEGALGTVLADYSSGMVLGSAGGGVNLELAAAGNSEVIKAKLATIKLLGLDDEIEDMLITLGKQYHLLRLLPEDGLFIYLVLDRNKANLAMARHKLNKMGTGLNI
jgi:hypothetical protein